MSLQSCQGLGHSMRYSQCINIDTRVIDKQATHNCCKNMKGIFDGKSKLCINDVNSSYGICCMKYSNKNEFIGIWSNFTLVEGEMLHNEQQIKCAKKKGHKIPKPKHTPHTNGNIKISYYDLD